MEHRKSLAHTLLENGRTSISSPLRRRSSIAVREVAAELAFNDDEAERVAIRLETNIATTPASSGRHSLSLGAVTRMSAPQIAEGISECIRLNTQNKINIKNAFSLNMIDFMTYMVRNKDEKISNLQMASQTLDVSAKIYGLRVDSLHQDILKMAGNLDPRDKDGPNDTENPDNNITDANDNPSQTQERQKKKRSKKNQKILTTIEALQGDIDVVSLTPPMFGETDCQTTDMLYQAMLPQHANHGVCLHPYNDVVLDVADNTNKNTDEQRIPWPPIQLDNKREIATMFTNFEFLNWSAEQEEIITPQSSQEPSSPLHEQLAFDLDASLPVDDGPNHTAMNYFDMNDDNDESQVGCYAAMHAPANIVNVNNTINKVPSKNLEYSFFQDNLDIRWAGPSHWKIKNVKNLGISRVVGACRQDHGRKKKDIIVLFSDESKEDCEGKFVVPVRNTAKLRAKTVKTIWSEEKITLPPENHDDKKMLISKFNLRPDDILNFVKETDANATILSDDADAYNYGNENDTINYCPNVETDEQQADDDNINDNPYESDGSLGGFMGDNLIEAPKLTQKIFIPYSQRAKKLDMRMLKKSIWHSLATKDDADKENLELKDAEQLSVMTIKEEKHFSDVYTGLPDKLSKHDSEELSFPLAFVSLLHLANEKGLTITAEEDLSDLIVKQDIK